MLKEEFDRIAGKICDPQMFEEINKVYMAFDDMTKFQIAVIYWGEMPGSYALYQRALDLYHRLKVGFNNDVQVDEWRRAKEALMVEIRVITNKLFRSNPSYGWSN
jgi:hypothetical protein